MKQEFEHEPKLVARREAFGYLVYQSGARRLHPVFTDSSDSSPVSPRFTLVGEDGTRITPKKVVVRQNRPLRSGILSAPIVVELYPTLACNERCFFCYAGDVLNTPHATLRKELIPTIVDRLTAAGVFRLAILGGEPFLYPSVDHLVEVATEADLDVSISTNGTVHRPGLMSTIRRRGVELNVSFHSHIPSVEDAIVGRSGAFDAASKTIEEASRQGIGPNVSIAITGANANHVSGTVEYLHSLGVRSVNFLSTQRAGWARDQSSRLIGFGQFLEIASQAGKVASSLGLAWQAVSHYSFLIDSRSDWDLDIGVMGMDGHRDGRRVLYVLSDGSVVATFYQNLKFPSLVGNITSDDLQTLWSNSPVLAHLRSLQPKVTCRSCSYFDRCRGGTPRILSESDDDMELPQCPVHAPDMVGE